MQYALGVGLGFFLHKKEYKFFTLGTVSCFKLQCKGHFRYSKMNCFMGLGKIANCGNIYYMYYMLKTAKEGDDKMVSFR